MTDINFSADMLGVKTLAQQGKSVMQTDGENCIGGFEDLILQLLANNAETDVAQIVENTIDTEKSDESEPEDVQSLLNEMILKGMINSDVQITDIVNTEEISNDVSVNEIAIAVTDKPKETREVYNEIKEDSSVINSVVANDENSEFVELVKSIPTEKQFSEVREDTSTVPSDIKQAEISEDIQIENDVREYEYGVDTVAIVNDEKQSVNSAVAEKKEEYIPSEFISTENMISLRNGNKINFETNKISFKVNDTPINIQSPNAAEDLADKILMRFDENQFEVELYPQHLGKITVNLTVKDGIVHVEMNSDNAKVNEFLVSQSANIQNIVEKNTQYDATVKVNDAQDMYQQHERDNAQHGADENQKNRQQEHMRNMYRRDIQHTEDFLSMLNMTV